MITKEDFQNLPIGSVILWSGGTVVTVTRHDTDDGAPMVWCGDIQWYWDGGEDWELVSTPETGTKHDGGKPAFHLLDSQAFMRLSAALDAGPAEADIISARRHLDAFTLAADDAIHCLTSAWATAARLLCPSNPLLATRLETAKALEFGSRKYAPNNWRQGFRWSRLIRAAMSHLETFARGDIIDSDSGCHHLACLSATVMFLVVHVRDGLGTDDRAEVWPRS